MENTGAENPGSLEEKNPKRVDTFKMGSLFSSICIVYLTCANVNKKI